MTLSLVLLIIAIFTPSFPAVKLSPGIPDKTSVVVETSIIFKNVTLTIRADEAIPIDYLMFVIYTSTHIKVANVTFDLDGTILYQNPSQFTVIKLTNTSNLPYNPSWGYGIDEETNNATTYDYGY
ncbi:MAG: hypothetical protein BV459_06410, partial [Thermoplasmata archaeon M11B2D]